MTEVIDNALTNRKVLNPKVIWFETSNYSYWWRSFNRKEYSG
jgi:hypothetical protein